MKASKLFEILSRTNERILNENEVVVQIKLPFTTVGARPTIPVSYASFGFDWDAGKFIIQPERSLTYADDAEFQEKFKKLQERAGWLDLENRNLKTEIKKLKKALGEENDAAGNL